MFAVARANVNFVRKGTPILARIVAKAMKAQVERVIQELINRSNFFKAPTVIDLEGISEDAWLQAIDAVFNSTDATLQLEIASSVLSGSVAAVDTVSNLIDETIDQELAIDVRQRLATQATGVGERISGIDDFTRRKYSEIIQRGIADGKTTSELATELRDQTDRIIAYRQLTIARTELNNAYTQGAARAYENSRAVPCLRDRLPGTGTGVPEVRGRVYLQHQKRSCCGCLLARIPHQPHRFAGTFSLPSR